MSITKKLQLKKDLIWNTLGSLTYAAAAAVMAFLAIRIAGEEDGGIFGFGYSTFGQQMFIIAYFGIRPFHITDVSREYSFAAYHRTRMFTTLLAVAAAAAYLGLLSVLGTYTLRKAGIVFLLSLVKIADGYADVYESECQRDGLLWRGGRELCFRTLLLCAVLLGALYVTGDLMTASVLAVLCQALCIAFFRHRLWVDARKKQQEDGGLGSMPAAASQAFGTGRKLSFAGFGKMFYVFRTRFGAEENRIGEQELRRKEVRRLLGSTVLLFLGVFLDFYVFSGAKYAVDAKLGDAANGVFNILFMPTSVIYLVANFVIKPFMTPMAEALRAGDIAGFDRTRRRIALLIGGVTALALLGVALFGSWILGACEWALGEAGSGLLTEHTGELFLIILGGGLYALANLYYYILVIKRRQKEIFLVYLTAAVITLAVSFPAVGAFGITGAAVCYASLMTLLAFGLKLCDLLAEQKTEKRP